MGTNCSGYCFKIQTEIGEIKLDSMSPPPGPLCPTIEEIFDRAAARFKEDESTEEEVIACQGRGCECVEVWSSEWSAWQERTVKYEITVQCGSNSNWSAQTFTVTMNYQIRRRIVLGVCI